MKNACLSDLFNSLPWDVAELNHRLCLYILAMQRTDGKKYPATTVYQLLKNIRGTDHKMNPLVPRFGMLQNCTINVNYGPSTVNIQHQATVA